MRVKGFQKENGGIRVELDEGQLLFWSVYNCSISIYCSLFYIRTNIRFIC